MLESLSKKTIIGVSAAAFFATVLLFYDWRKGGFDYAEARDAIRTTANVFLAVGVCLAGLQLFMSWETQKQDNLQRETIRKVENEQRWVQNLIRLHELWHGVLDRLEVRDDLEWLSQNVHRLSEADFLKIVLGEEISEEIGAERSKRFRVNFIATLNVLEIIVVANAYNYSDEKLVGPTLIDPARHYYEQLEGFMTAWKQSGHKGWRAIDEEIEKRRRAKTSAG